MHYLSVQLKAHGTSSLFLRVMNTVAWRLRFTCRCTTCSSSHSITIKKIIIRMQRSAQRGALGTNAPTTSCHHQKPAASAMCWTTTKRNQTFPATWARMMSTAKRYDIQCKLPNPQSLLIVVTYLQKIISIRPYTG